MTGLPLFHPGVDPPHDTAIARGEYLLGIEARLGRAGKELLPERPDPIVALEALTVRRGPRTFKDARLVHQGHDGVDVMTVEGLVEALHDVTWIVQEAPPVELKLRPNRGPAQGVWSRVRCESRPPDSPRTATFVSSTTTPRSTPHRAAARPIQRR